jgi:hypothetical protein
LPLTFTETDIKLVSFLHIDAMVMTTHIDKWNVTRVLIDNGSHAEILFFSAFNQMDIGGRRIEPIGSISLRVSFGSLRNA